MEPESSGSSGPVDFRILGLDVGIASVGAAVNLGQEMIEGLYVRAFDKAEVAKTGESLNAVRREARGVRRGYADAGCDLRTPSPRWSSHHRGDLPSELSRLSSRQRHGRSGLRGSTVNSPPLEFAAAICHLQKYRGSRPTAGTHPTRTTTAR